MRVSIFDNQYQAVRMLPPEEQELFWTSIMAYAFDGVEPRFEGVQAAIFAMMKPALDKSIEGQINGAKGGNGRGNTVGVKPPSKTPIKNHLKKPSEKNAKTPTENQKERKRKEIEENGRVLDNLKLSKTSSSTDSVAVADKPAPLSDYSVIFQEVDKLYPEPKDMEEYVRNFNEEHDEGCVPCPDGLNPFKAVV